MQSPVSPTFSAGNCPMADRNLRLKKSAQNSLIPLPRTGLADVLCKSKSQENTGSSAWKCWEKSEGCTSRLALAPSDSQAYQAVVKHHLKMGQSARSHSNNVPTVRNLQQTQPSPRDAGAGAQGRFVPAKTPWGFVVAPGHQKNCRSSCRKHFTVVQLVPVEVGNAEDPGKAIHCLATGNKVLEVRCFYAGVRVIRNAKAQAGSFADLGQHSAQIYMTQVQRQRVGQHSGQLLADSTCATEFAEVQSSM